MRGRERGARSLADTRTQTIRQSPVVCRGSARARAASKQADAGQQQARANTYRRCEHAHSVVAISAFLLLPVALSFFCLCLSVLPCPLLCGVRPLRRVGQMDGTAVLASAMGL
jgi:hypothetical protein